MSGILPRIRYEFAVHQSTHVCTKFHREHPTTIRSTDEFIRGIQHEVTGGILGFPAIPPPAKLFCERTAEICGYPGSSHLI